MIGLEQPPASHGGRDVYAHALEAVRLAPRTPVGQLAALFHDVGKVWGRNRLPGPGWYPGHAALGAPLALRALRRVGCDEALAERVARLVANHHAVHALRGLPDRSRVEEVLARVGRDLLEDLLDLGEADERAHLPARRFVPAIREHLARLAVEGTGVREAGGR